MEFFETEIYKRYLEILNRDGCLPQNRDGLGAQGLGAAEPQAVSFGELLEKYDAFCFDGYGTLYNAEPLFTRGPGTGLRPCVLRASRCA